MMRLNKFLAEVGVASRRQADRMIADGRISVNGVSVTTLGLQIDPARDRVLVDGKPLQPLHRTEYLILNKPVGYLCTVHDPFGRPTVMDFIPNLGTRVYPVGRLDLDTSGLLFFTNDGVLSLALTHPRHWVEKVYQAKVRGAPTREKLQMLSRGIDLEDGRTAPAKIEIESQANGNAIIRLVLREGRKRQVRRMLSAIDHPVLELKRLAMGPLWLGDLEPGKIRRPTERELHELMALKAKLSPKAAEES